MKEGRGKQEARAKKTFWAYPACMHANFHSFGLRSAHASRTLAPRPTPQKSVVRSLGPDRNVGVTRNGMLRMEHIVTDLKGDLNLIRTRLITFSDEITHALSRDLPQSDDEEEDNDVKLSITQKHEVQ